MRHLRAPGRLPSRSGLLATGKLAAAKAILPARAV